MARKYNLGDSFKEGDPGHPQTHSALGAAVNDLDDRLEGLVNDNARLNTAGFVRGVFIPSGGTIPTGLPPYTIVIEMS